MQRVPCQKIEAYSTLKLIIDATSYFTAATDHGCMFSKKKFLNAFKFYQIYMQYFYIIFFTESLSNHEVPKFMSDINISFKIFFLSVCQRPYNFDGVLDLFYLIL